MARSIAAPASPLPRAVLEGVTRPLVGTARTVRTGAKTIWAHRRARIATIAVAALIALAIGGWQLARRTSLTAVEHVQITGLVTTPAAATNSAAIEAALTNAAHGMSTLGISTAALRAAVVRYPIVRSIRAQASFPHKLRVEVVEQPPVAVLVFDGERTAVAADGVVLGESYSSSGLPEVNIGKTNPLRSSSARTVTTATTAMPTLATLPTVGKSVHGGVLLQELTVLGAAPQALARGEITHVYMSTKGLTIALHGGLLAYFGDGTRAHAKWISLTRVLASPSSAGAAYIDVRLPERPAAGFPPGVTRPDASSSEAGAGAGEAEANASHPGTAAELASGLDAAVSGNTSSSTGASPSAGASSNTGASSSAGASSSVGTASTGASTGTGAKGPEEASSTSASEPASSSTSTESELPGTRAAEATG
jgi:cell division protein FtsQ